MRKQLCLAMLLFTGAVDAAEQPVLQTTAKSETAALCGVTVPKEVVVLAPNKDVPAEFARFSGVWTGGQFILIAALDKPLPQDRWKAGGYSCASLVVEHIRPDGASVATLFLGSFFSEALQQSSGFGQGMRRSFDVQIKDGVLTGWFGNTRSFKFEWANEGDIQLTWHAGRSIYTTTLRPDKI